MEERMSKILTDELMKRISFCSPDFIKLDVHGLSVKAALKLIKNISCLWNKPFSCEVIHGYNHGCEILKAVRRETLCHRNYNLTTNPANAGVTILRFQ